MAMEHARSFVERVFENDEFIREVIRKRGFTRNENNSEDVENEKMVKVANDLGFKFDTNEYEVACREYMDNLGGWEATKKILHVIKIVSIITNENE